MVAAEGKTFCAGGDRATLAAAGADPAAEEAFAGLTTIYRAFTRVGELEAPTIAAVAGHAVGAGLNLALATDLRIVAEDVVLTSGFIPIGLHPGGGHTALLGRTGAREAAAALALFGERIDGRARSSSAWPGARSPADEVLATAMELARVPAADPELARRTARSLRWSPARRAALAGRARGRARRSDVVHAAQGVHPTSRRAPRRRRRAASPPSATRPTGRGSGGRCGRCRRGARAAARRPGGAGGTPRRRRPSAAGRRRRARRKA